MANVGKHPGVYPEIIDLSQITENASTSIIAAVGEARKGSIFKRKYITSAAAMHSTYGTPDLKYGYLNHCMTCAMTDAGEAYVVRVVAEDSTYAGVKVPAEGKEMTKFVDGYSLKEVDATDSEEEGASQSFFYRYQIDSKGHYILDDEGQRIMILDGDDPVIDTDTVMTIVGENPNMDDVRVSMTETTVIPSNKKAVSVSLQDIPTMTSDDELVHNYYATVNTGSTEHGLKQGDKVIISNASQAAFNGTFKIEKVVNEGAESYPVRLNSIYEDEQTYYVASEPKKKVSKAQNETLDKSCYVESPATNFCYKFKTLALKGTEGATTGVAYEEPVYVHASRPEDSTLTSGWYIPVISADHTVPGLFFVKVNSPSSALQEGLNVYATPDDSKEPVGHFSTATYENLQLGAKRFMLANVPYSTTTDFVNEDGEWTPSSGVPGTSSYEDGSESVFFVYFGKYKFVKAGSRAYNDADLTDLCMVEDLTDEQGRAKDGALMAEVDSDFNLVLKQFVKADTMLYTDSLLIKPFIVAGVGEYFYKASTPIVSETNAFQYKLLENPEDPSEESIKNMTVRWVKSPTNAERKFDLSVYVVEDGVFRLVESYNNLTMYNNVDGFGTQTKITSKINGKSAYIRVILNDYLMTEDNVPFPKMLSTVSGKLVGGYTDDAITPADIMKGWDLFAEYDKVTVNLLMGCGYANPEVAAIEQKMLEIAKGRRDSFCVLDVPVDSTKSGVDQVVENYRKNILGIDSCYAALYTPWVKVYDTFSGTNDVLLPPSGFACGVIARTDANRGVWVAPAGMNNGAIACAALTPTGLTQEYTSAEQDSVYSAGVNYIRKTSGMYLIWGQKTLQFKPSALDRINVTRMVIYIETSLREAAKWHLFEQNTAYRRAQITMQFEAWLDPIKAAGGLNEYKVVCDETNNGPEIRSANQMVIDIYVKPEYAAEFIKLNTIVQGANAVIGVVG